MTHWQCIHIVADKDTKPFCTTRVTLTLTSCISQSTQKQQRKNKARKKKTHKRSPGVFWAGDSLCPAASAVATWDCARGQRSAASADTQRPCGPWGRRWGRNGGERQMTVLQCQVSVQMAVRWVGEQQRRRKSFWSDWQRLGSEFSSMTVSGKIVFTPQWQLAVVSLTPATSLRCKCLHARSRTVSTGKELALILAS